MLTSLAFLAQIAIPYKILFKPSLSSSYPFNVPITTTCYRNIIVEALLNTFSCLLFIAQLKSHTSLSFTTNNKPSLNIQTHTKFTMGSTQDMNPGKPVLFLLAFSRNLLLIGFELTFFAAILTTASIQGVSLH